MKFIKLNTSNIVSVGEIVNITEDFAPGCDFKWRLVAHLKDGKVEVLGIYNDRKQMEDAASELYIFLEKD